MVTGRVPTDALYHALCERIQIARIGDCSAPGTIAAAVYAGHRYAQELDSEPADVPFLREGSMR
jgi:dimethylamine/trimethylamine dehydrogenase